MTAAQHAAATLAHAAAEAAALTPAPVPPHGPDSTTCPGCAARCHTPETHNWGCGCAPHGPGAARQVATYIGAHAHSHLSVDGHDECLSGDCRPLTPGEVLL